MDPYLYLILVGLFDLIGMVTGKLWYTKNNWLYLVICLLSFLFVGYFFALASRFQPIALANIFWAALTTILVTLSGYIIFKEHLSVQQIIGMIIVIIGVIVVELHS